MIYDISEIQNVDLTSSHSFLSLSCAIFLENEKNLILLSSSWLNDPPPEKNS
mgnify:CR=1 FL=1